MQLKMFCFLVLTVAIAGYADNLLLFYTKWKLIEKNISIDESLFYHT